MHLALMPVVGAGYRNGCADGDRQRSRIRGDREHDVARGHSTSHARENELDHTEKAASPNVATFSGCFLPFIHRCPRSKIREPCHARSRFVVPAWSARTFHAWRGEKSAELHRERSTVLALYTESKHAAKEMKHDPNMHLHDYNARD